MMFPFLCEQGSNREKASKAPSRKRRGALGYNLIPFSVYLGWGTRLSWNAFRGGELGFCRLEKLLHNFSGRRIEHALSHRCNQAADLRFTSICELRVAAVGSKLNAPLALYKSRQALAVQLQDQRMRRTFLRKFQRAGIFSGDRGDTELDCSFKAIGAVGFEPFTAGEQTGEPRRIGEQR